MQVRIAIMHPPHIPRYICCFPWSEHVWGLVGNINDPWTTWEVVWFDIIPLFLWSEPLEQMSWWLIVWSIDGLKCSCRHFYPRDLTSFYAYHCTWMYASIHIKIFKHAHTETLSMYIYVRSLDTRTDLDLTDLSSWVVSTPFGCQSIQISVVEPTSLRMHWWDCHRQEW